MIHYLNNIVHWFKENISTKKKWPLSATRFLITIFLCNLVIYNIPLLQFITSGNIGTPPPNAIITASILVLFLLIHTLIFYLLLLLSTQLTRWFSILLTICNSIALYFVATYHVILDRTMMGNILNANTEEMLSFFHPNLFIYALLLGVVPALLLCKVKITPTSKKHFSLHALSIVVFCLGFMLINSHTWFWIDKHAKIIGALNMPWSYSINTLRFYIKERAKQKNYQLLPSASFINNEKKIVILIIGETARAHNFSLYQYKKTTNPQLSKEQIIALNAIACSTYTTKSLQCILSHTESSFSYEPLPNYLHRHNVDVIWRTNNSGEPLIKVNSYTTGSELHNLCKGEGCSHDAVLLAGLQERIQASTADKIFVVLHTQGSHGPSYDQRYPQQFARFKPVCKSVILAECSTEELLNAYDNSIVYTDYVISQVIQLLKNLTYPTAMMYISDHGESLGEYGLYLHGTPFTIAPDYQKNIPFIIWTSTHSNNTIGNTATLDLNTLNLNKQYTHHHIFHTTLGLLGIRSSIYRPDLDIFHPPSIENQ